MTLNYNKKTIVFYVPIVVRFYFFNFNQTASAVSRYTVKASY